MKNTKIEFTNFPQDTNWVKGRTTNGYTFTAKLYDEPSEEYGIKGGRVSKLEIRTQQRIIIVNYDRGWDIRPTTTEDKAEFKAILAFLEASPKRWADEN